MASHETGPALNGENWMLQQKYTKLLEERIAQLELLVKNGSSVTANHDTDAEASKVKSNGTSSSNKEDQDAQQKDKKGEEGKGGKEAVVDGGEKDGKKTSKSRYRNIVRQWDKKTGAQEDIVLGENKRKDADGEIAYTFRRVLDPETGVKDAYSEIDIESRGLRELLKETIGDYPGQNFDGETVEITRPFEPLVHNWNALEKAAKENSDDDVELKQSREDLARLLETTRAAPELEKYFRTRESNLNAKITTFETMWTLFPPSELVVAKPFQNMHQIFCVERAPILYEKKLPRKLQALAWCWDWDGKEWTKVYHWLDIDNFRGTKDINQLACYPLKYHQHETPEAKAKFTEDLRKRGEKYHKIVRSKTGATQMHSYKGDAIREGRNVRSRNDDEDATYADEDRSSNTRETIRRTTLTVEGSFIVDHEAFLQFGIDGGLGYALGEKQNACWVGDLNDQSDEARRQADRVEKNPSEEDFLLFPPRFLGYSTKEKMWGQFSVEDTEQAKGKNPKVFQEKLELNDQYKKMIQALVNEHEGKGQEKDGDKAQVKDLVADKGKGLVLLLHGPPGVGKTLTAETIAEATGKPLFVVSVAEIGLNASKAEKNLETMFHLAGKWEAVLLVDEADVFMEMRNRASEPNRNALVSVLLRVLEYYHGIMILTTNRVTAIDHAIQSRIHLAIRYDDLDKEQKKRIFKFFLQQLHPDSIKEIKAIYNYIDEYGCEYKLNGRQIRNVVSSALSLARSEAKQPGSDGDDRLTEKRLKEVMIITKDFVEQLDVITKEARAANEAQRSRP